MTQSYLAKKFSWRFNIKLKYFQGTYWQLFQNLEINLSNSVNFSSKAIKFKLYRSFVMYTCICLNNRVAQAFHTDTLSKDVLGFKSLNTWQKFKQNIPKILFRLSTTSGFLSLVNNLTNRSTTWTLELLASSLLYIIIPYQTNRTKSL